MLIVIAVVEGLEGLFKLPLVIERDPVIFGKGWGSYAVGAELVLTLPFALAALFFLIKGDFRRGIGFVAGIALLRWISLLPSVREPPGLVSGLRFFGCRSGPADRGVPAAHADGHCARL